MADQIKVQWRGYIINKSGAITDSQAREYRFLNTGSAKVTINNILLLPGQGFNEDLQTGEISFGDWNVEFDPKVGIKELSVSIKVQVGK